MLALGLSLIKTIIMKMKFIDAWILNADTYPKSGYTYRWDDTATWSDTNKWKG